jgi:hypothetical protein
VSFLHRRIVVDSLSRTTMCLHRTTMCLHRVWPTIPPSMLN